jgi:hypothetical protein
MITDKKIYVMSIPRKSVQGRTDYNVETSTGRRIAIGRSKARGVQIPVGFIKDSSNHFITGLDDHIDNPYYKQEANTIPKHLKIGSLWIDSFDAIKERETIDKQTLLEILDNKEKGTYTSRSGMPMMTLGNDKTAFKDIKPTFFDNFHIYLTEGTNTFSGNTHRGRLAIQILELHPKVANSKDVINETYHEFYIGEAEEGLKEQNKEIDLVISGLGNYDRLKKDYDSFTEYQVAVILGLVRGDASPSLTENMLKNYLWEQKKNTYGTQHDRIRKFNKYFDVLQENKDAVYISYLLKQALNVGTVFTDGGYFFWKSQKGRPELYKQYSQKKFETLLYNHLQDYDPQEERTNHFKEFEDELKDKGVQCK